MSSVSVVIPFYNGAEFIRECLQSVWNQSIEPKEIIIVNDGSTDGSEEVLVKVLEGGPGIVLHKSNGGQGAARNYGVANASGDLICFLDQDDIWYPDHIAVLRKAMEDGTHVDWIYSNMDVIDRDGEMFARRFLDTIDGASTEKQTLVQYLSSNLYMLPGSSIIRREAFLKVGGFDPRLSGYEDDDLFLRLFRAGCIGRYFDVPTYQWRVYSASASYSFQMVRNRMIYARKLIEKFPDRLSHRMYLATSDIIAMRFLPQMLDDYRAAVERGETENASWALGESIYLARFLKSKRGQRLSKALQRSANPPIWARALPCGSRALQRLVRKRYKRLFQSQ